MKSNFYLNIQKNKWLHPVLLAVCALAAYYPVFGHDFLYYWDDQWQVFNHYTESGYTLNNFWAIFTEFYGEQYSPVNQVMYLVIYSIFGYKPFWFHATCLLLHISNAILVYLCINSLLKINRRFETNNKNTVAFLTALIFAIHPLNVEAVAWISASKIVVYSFFYLLATLSFISFLRIGKIKYYFITLLLFVFSFFGKEQAVIFPVWLLLIYWLAGYWAGKIGEMVEIGEIGEMGKEAEAGKTNTKKVWLAIMPFFVLSFAFGIITILSQTGDGSLVGHGGYPFWQRIVFACYSFTEHFQKTVFPFKLLYLYPFPSVQGEPLPQWMLFYPLILTVLLISLWKLLIKNNVVLFCLMFFTIHISLTTHIISMQRFVITADRYVYLASIGIYFAISYYFVFFMKKLKGLKKTGIVIAFIAYLLYFGIYTNIRSRVWRDVETLNKEIIELKKL